MPAFRTANNAYAIVSYSYGLTGAAVNTAGAADALYPGPLKIDTATNALIVQPDLLSWNWRQGAVEDPPAGPAIVPLDPAAATSSATLALTAPTTVALGQAGAVSSATLALTAPTTIPLGTAAATSSATLALTVPTAARSFNGSGDLIAAAAPSQTGALTMAAWVRRTRSAAVDWVMVNSDAGVSTHIMRFNSSDQLQFFDGTTNRQAASVTATDADGWVIVAVTKATGSATPRFHIYKGGAWTHADGGGVSANPATSSVVTFSSGISGAVTYPLDLALAAEWTSALSDANVESLVTNRATSDWTALSPDAAWEFDQASNATPVIDVTGNDYNQTSITGTSVITTGPSPWNYMVQADLTLSTAAASSSATLALTAPTTVPLATAAAQSSATLALSAKTTVALGTAAATSSATLALTAATQIPLQSAAAISSATLALKALTVIALAPSTAISSATLALIAQTYIPLQTSAAQSSATLAVTVPSGVLVPLDAAAAQSTASLLLSVQTVIALGAAAGVSSATLDLFAPGAVGGGMDLNLLMILFGDDD